MMEKVLSLGMCFSLAIPAVACSNKKATESSGTDTTVSGSDAEVSTGGASTVSGEKVVKETDPYYQLTETELDFPVADGQTLQSRKIDSIRIFSSSIVALVRNEYEVPADILGKWISFQMGQIKLDADEERQLTDRINASTDSRVVVFNTDGSIRCSYKPEVTTSVHCAFEGPNGEVKVLYGKYAENTSGVFIATISDTGELTDTHEVTDSNVYGDEAVTLPDGNILIAGPGMLTLCGADGNVINRVNEQSLSGRIFRIDGEYYVLGREVSGTDILDAKLYFSKVDTSTGNLTGEKIFTENNNLEPSLIAGEDAVYMNTGEALAKVDLIKGSGMENTLSWNDTDCVHSGIRESSVRILPGEEYSFIRDLSPSENTSEDIDSVKLVHLKKEASNPHAGKNIIVLGGTDIDNPVFIEHLVEYNRDPSKKSRIIVKDYASEKGLLGNTLTTENMSEIADKVYLDMLSGTGPDILMNFSPYMQFDTDDVLLDLNQYIDGAQGLDRGVLFDNVIRSFEKDGKLYQIPITFTMMGFAGSSDLIGDRTHWTMTDFSGTAESLKDHMQMMPQMSWNGLLKLLLGNYVGSCIDYGKKEVNFDTPEVRRIMEFVKQNGSSKTDGELLTESFNTLQMDQREMVNTGLVAMIDTQVFSLQYFAYIANSCGGKLSFVGYPADGEGGMTANASLSMAISKNSAYPEEAWEFIRYMNGKDQQVSCVNAWGGFPLNREALDVLCQKQQTFYEEMAKDGDTMMLDQMMISRFDENTVADLKKTIGNIHVSYETDPTVMMIIEEEAPAYFSGQRSLDDVINNINNRAKQVVSERG